MWKAGADRWSLFMDIDGFSKVYEEDHVRALLALGAMMEALYFLGSRVFCDEPHRLFIHQLGDGFVVIPSFAESSLRNPLAIAVIALRHVLANGGAARAAISTGDFSDISGCYPDVIQDAMTDHGVLMLGEGLMTIFPVMGSALINSHRLEKTEPKGSLVVVQSDLIGEIPAEYSATQVGAEDTVVVDWIGAENDFLSEAAARAGIAMPTTDELKSYLETYINETHPPDYWIDPTCRFNHCEHLLDSS